MAHWYLRTAKASEPSWGGRECFAVTAEVAAAAVERAIKADMELDWADLPKHSSFAQLLMAIKKNPRQ